MAFRSTTSISSLAFFEALAPLKKKSILLATSPLFSTKPIVLLMATINFFFHFALLSLFLHLKIKKIKKIKKLKKIWNLEPSEDRRAILHDCIHLPMIQSYMVP